MSVDSSAEQLMAVNTESSESLSVGSDVVAAISGHLALRAVHTIIDNGRRPGTRYGSLDTLSQYLNEIGQVELLSAEEERLLAQIIEQGQQAANEEDPTRNDHHHMRAGELATGHFIRANLRFVVGIAKKFPRSPYVELKDLIQEGNEGLRFAVKNYDWRKGTRFTTYADQWVRQAIARGIDKHGSIVHIPGNQHAAMRRALRRVGNDIDALDDDTAELARLANPIHLDRPTGAELDSDFHDWVISPADIATETQALTPLVTGEFQALVESVVTDSQDAAFLLYFFGFLDGEPHNYTDTAAYFGVSDTTAGIKVKRALEQLRSDPLKDRMQSFADSM